MVRLIGYEFRKIAQNRKYLFIFLVLLLLNGSVLYLDTQKKAIYTASAYRSLHEDIEEISIEEAVAVLVKNMKLADYCVEMQLGADEQDLMEKMGEEGDEILAAYKNGDCPRYTDNPYAEQQLFRRVLAEYRHCEGYQKYLDGIQNSAKQMEKLAELQGLEGYHYLNVKKTAKKFSGSTADGVRTGPTLGIEYALNADFTDYSILLFVFLAVLVLMMREKEQQQLLLSRTTMKGRGQLGGGKLLAGFAISGLTVVCFYGANLLLYGGLYGLGDLTRKIQSLERYRSCPFQVAVWEYIVLFVLAKILVCWLFSGIFSLAAVCARNSIGLYLSVLAVLGVESIIYFFARGSVLFFNLRKLNIIAFLKTNSVLEAYQNLNVGGVPVNYQMMFAYVVFGGIVLVSGISVMIFAHQKGVHLVSSRGEKLTRFLHLPMHRNLFIHECYKILWQGKVALIIAGLAVAVWYFYKPIEQRFPGPEERYYHLYMTKYEGRYTKEKHEDIKNSISSLDEQEMEILLHPSEDTTADEMRLQSILVKRTALYQVLERAEYLSETEQGAFVYEDGYRLLTGHPSGKGKNYTLALQMVLVTIICLAGIYGIEYETGMARLVASYARGRRELACRKLFIALLVATVIYGLTYAPYFYNVLHAYGTTMLGAPAYSLPELGKYSISLKWYLILVCTVRYIGVILAVGFILWVTCRVKRTSVVIALSTAVFIMPILLALLNVWGADFFLWNPFWNGRLW